MPSFILTFSSCSPSNYRMLVMGATFQTSGHRNTLETMFHKPFRLSVLYPDLLLWLAHGCNLWITCFSIYYATAICKVCLQFLIVRQHGANTCAHTHTHTLCAESTAWQVEPVSVFSLKQTNLHCPDSGKQAQQCAQSTPIMTDQSWREVPRLLSWNRQDQRGIWLIV